MVLGGIYRWKVDTTPEATATYANVQDEVTVTLSLTSREVDASSKDTGKHEKMLKTLLGSSLSVTINVNHTTSGTNLGYDDIFTLWTKNNSDTYNGVRKMKLVTTESGGYELDFEAYVVSVSAPFGNAELAQATVELKIVTLPTLAAVA